MDSRPQDRTETKDSPRIAYAIGLTRLGMWWEQAARAFWPLLAVVALAFAVLAFGLTDHLSRRGLWAAMGVAALAVLAALYWGIRRYHTPSRAEARTRVDQTLPGRPLSALRDQMALGQGDAGSDALWQAHLRRMQTEAERALAVRPDADLPRRDPMALRLAALTALAMALFFAPSGQLGQGLAALASTFKPAPVDPQTSVAGLGWEGWAEPPKYTRRPTIYLNALPEGDELTLPKGSEVSFRLYGEGAAVSQDIGPAQPSDDPAAPTFIAEKDGVIQVGDRSFPIIVQPDIPPAVEPGAAPTRRADGRLVQQFTAKDDNGIAEGQATITLDLAAVDRRYGLTPDPEPRDALEVKLPLPATGQRKDIKGQLVADLSRHPWANLPVTIKLEVTDGIDQKGTSQPMQMVLPGRRFFDPLGAALIDIRRDLLWTRQNSTRDAEVLRAIVWQPDEFMDEELAKGLNSVISTLEAGPLSESDRDKIADKLWEAAVALEDGGLADALARMQQAQERLSEAIRNGASPDEIQRLMDELREATNAYTDMLAEQGEDPSQKFDRSPKDKRQQITGDQVQKMMDEIQRLMNEGRMAEAQELLEQFNRMMENLKMTDSEDPNGFGRGRPMNRLSDTLREQQQLSDEAMRQMQDEFMQDPFGQQGQQGQQEQQGGQQGEQGQPGKQGQQGPQGQGQQGRPGEQGQPQAGPGGQGGQSLADRQRALREELGRQRGLLPGQGTAQGDAARRQLDEAGRAMEQAEQALRDGDATGALEGQGAAIQSMREGLRALGELMAQQDQQRGQDGQNGQQGEEGQPSGRSGDQRADRGLGLPYSREPSTDPLGRSLSGQGNIITSGDPLAEGPDPTRQARGLLDEIRRRLGERERSDDERDYLGRLLEEF